MRIRHVAVCTADAWGAEARVMDVLQLAVVQRDPTEPPIDLRNGVFALQHTFLEVSTPATPAAPMQRFLAKHGDGGYMVCLQVDDLDAARARAESVGVRVVFSVDKRRVGEATVSSAHLHPADTGGTLFSFEQADPPDSWAWAGEAWPDYRRGDVVQDVVGVELASREPEQLAQRLGALFDLAVIGNSLDLAPGRIAIVPSPEGIVRDRLVAVELTATDRARVGEEHTLAGTVFRFV